MGFFGRKRAPSVPHPRKEPRFDGPLTLERLEQIFQDCVDFTKRPVSLGAVSYTHLLCQLFHAFDVRSERSSLFHIGVFSNPAMNKAFLIGLTMQLAVLCVPPLQVCLLYTSHHHRNGHRHRQRQHPDH